MADPYQDRTARMTDGVHAESRMLGDVKFHQHAGVDASVAERWKQEGGEDFLGAVSRELAERLGYTVEPESRWLPIRRTAIVPDAPLPLSFAQQRLWFLDQLEPGSPTYNIPVAVRLSGDLDAGALCRALDEVVRRHSVLRTTFGVVDQQSVQRVMVSRTLEVPTVDLSGLPALVREAETGRLAGTEARRPFDLARGPLLRATLLRLGSAEHVGLFTLHHIVGDGWSMGVLVREVAALYGAFLGGAPSPLPELAVQYADYALWQREWLQGEVLEEQLAYWRRILDGLSVLHLPTDRPRPAVQRFVGADEPFFIPAAASRDLLDLARGLGLTPYMALLAVFAGLLHRYSSQEDLVLGSTSAGRNRRELEPLIGFFVNTLAMRTDLSGRPSVGELLRRVRETVLGAFDHQDLPFEKLVAELQPERDLSRSPLFQVVFQLQNASTEVFELPGLVLTPVAASSQTAKFDLVLNLMPLESGLAGVWKYNTDLFDRTTLVRMTSHLRTLLASAAAEPGTSLGELPLLTTAEEQQLLEWNDAPATSPDVACLHELFAAQAASLPEATALVSGEERLSYGELDRRANQLARHLRARGITTPVLVGLCFERSLEMVVGILGVLKAGGAYVPLDPAYPRDRLAFMLADSRVPVLLTDERLLGDLPEPAPGMEVICLDRDWEEIGSESGAGLSGISSGLAPAYVIYTSGSTGRPKGVVVSHGNVSRLFSATAPWFGFGREDVWTLFHSYAFDFSVWELWGALLHGGGLVIVSYPVSRSPESFYELLRREGVTVLNQTPSAFRQLLWAEEGLLAGRKEIGPELSLRWVIFGGEALELQSLGPWFERHGDVRPRLVNMYGITETTVHVTYRELRAADLSGASGSVVGSSNPRSDALRPRPGVAASSPGYPGGDPRRWRGSRPGLPRSTGADGGAVRPGSVRRGGRPSLSLGRPGPPTAGWRPRIPGPDRSSGQDPRFPDRAGRDRVGPGPASFGAGNRGAGAGGRSGRGEPAGGVCGVQ